MGQSVQWTYNAESMAHRGSAVRQLSIERSDLLRCVWGNPFRSSEIAAACLTRDVIGLAERIYHEQNSTGPLSWQTCSKSKLACAEADVWLIAGYGGHMGGDVGYSTWSSRVDEEFGIDGPCRALVYDRHESAAGHCDLLATELPGSQGSSIRG